MELPHLTIRAVLFDVYGTLLEVGPPPPDADAAWERLWRDRLQVEPRGSRLEFSIACNQAIARLHEVARARGIAWPEVHWPSVVAEVVPEVTRLSVREREEFLLGQMQTGHTTRMTEEAAETLRWLKARSSRLGLASNAQSYTLRELRLALAGHGLGLDLFEPDLCFWSFEHGFSKPDPHVFQILTARLTTRGIPPAATLMVGDRPDNDIAPAQAHGWQTWHFRSQAESEEGGGWEALRRWLEPRSIG